MKSVYNKFLINIISFLLLPFLVLITFTFYFYRLIIILVTKLLHFDYDTIIDFLDVYFLVDNLYSKPCYSIIFNYVLKGQVNPVDFNTLFYNVFIAQNTPNNSNNYAYNRLQQYPESFGGYYFWKWDRDFDLDQHILYFNGNDEEVTTDNLCQVLGRKVRAPYRKNAPLWEINIISNFNGDLNQTLLIFKFHHCIMDGKSLVGLMESGFMVYDKESNNNPANSIGKAQKSLKSSVTAAKVQNSFIEKLKSILAAPAELYQEAMSLYDDNIFMSRKSDTNTNDWLLGVTDKFHLNDFKSVRVKLGVTTTSIFLGGISGGLNKFIKKTLPKQQRPSNIHFLNPSPWDGHPTNQLVNHFTMSTLNMNLTDSSLTDRIKYMNEEFTRSTKYSTFPKFGFYALKTLGYCPTFILNQTTRFGNFTTSLSNIAGPTGAMNCFGHDVLDFQIFLPLAGDIPAFNFLVFSFNRQFRIAITSNKASLQSQDQVNELSQMITSELKELLAEFNKQD